MGTEVNKEFSAEEYRMAEKHLKKWWTSLVVREIQIKTTLRFYLTPVRMAKFKNLGDSRCWWGCGERGTLLDFWWYCKLIHTLEISLEVPQKIGHSTIGGSSNTTPGHIPRRCSTCNKDTFSTMFVAVLFVITRSCKEPRCPSAEEWYRKYDTFTRWITKQLLKTMNLWNS